MEIWNLGPKGSPFNNSTYQYGESLAQFRLASCVRKLVNVNTFYVWKYSRIFTKYCIAIQPTAIPDKSYFPTKNTDQKQLFTALLNESQLSILPHAFNWRSNTKCFVTGLIKTHLSKVCLWKILSTLTQTSRIQLNYACCPLIMVFLLPDTKRGLIPVTALT